MVGWKVLTIANIVPRKRIDLCALACARLEKEHELEWTVIGRGPQLETVRRLAPKSMKFLDRVENLTPFYKQADLFVLPSVDEGFGMVYVEAIMCGCPVICRKDDGGEEIVKTTGGGIAVALSQSNEASVGEIMKAVKCILSDRVRYMSPEIIERARKMVDPDTIRIAWTNLLDKYADLIPVSNVH